MAQGTHRRHLVGSRLLSAQIGFRDGVAYRPPLWCWRLVLALRLVSFCWDWVTYGPRLWIVSRVIGHTLLSSPSFDSPAHTGLDNPSADLSASSACRRTARTERLLARLAT